MRTSYAAARDRGASSVLCRASAPVVRDRLADRHLEGLDACATMIAGWAEAAGCAVDLLPSPVGLHVVARTPAVGAGRILLLGHHDTVFPTGTAAARPLRVEGERALGPGVADMKGGVLVGLAALERLVGQRCRRRVAFGPRRGGPQRRALHARDDARRGRRTLPRMRARVRARSSPRARPAAGSPSRPTASPRTRAPRPTRAARRCARSRASCCASRTSCTAPGPA